jgi:hypothetical protein
MCLSGSYTLIGLERDRLYQRHPSPREARHDAGPIFMLGGAPAAHEVFSECMVRRRVASEKRRMAFGLRQCIRPSVEPVTPGHDGYPLALVRIMWTVW